MERKPKNLGRAYLVGKLRERGLSRRDSVRILNAILDEMIKELRRGKDVEFPFGRLRRVKRLSERWLAIGDEPMNAYTVEHELDEEGCRLLEGPRPPEPVPAGAEKKSGK